MILADIWETIRSYAHVASSKLPALQLRLTASRMMSSLV